LLRSTAMPVKTVAGTVGFASRSHFSRAFRDVYGIDPLNFRATSELLFPIPCDELRTASQLASST